ncbi:MAG: chemotaxis response regulator protein-glutamate methylesterase [Pseudomonadota bacterium]
MTARKKVLIVDDSKVVQHVLTEILSLDDSIEVVGTASDPFEAYEKIEVLKPDVITLDVEMPGMNGIDFLRTLLKRHPLPVVMISSYTRKNNDIAIEALAAGAFDIATKPLDNPAEGLRRLQKEIIEKIKIAAAHPDIHIPSLGQKKEETFSNESFPEDHVILIGASTGGIQAVEYILKNLPSRISGIVIAQHIPPSFVASVAKRLDSCSNLIVREARDGDIVKHGKVFIGPGRKQMRLKKSNTGYVLTISERSADEIYAPSIDILFSSAVESLGKRALAILLTGMGRDGAEGMLKLKQAGAHTITQDYTSSMVFGMPKAAIELQAAQEIIHLESIPQAIIKYLQSVNRKA